MADDTVKRYKRLERSQKQLVWLAYIGLGALSLAGVHAFYRAAMRLATSGPTRSQAADIAIEGLVGLALYLVGGWVVYRMLRVLSDMLDALVDTQRQARATSEIVDKQMVPTVNQLMRMLVLPDAERQRLYVDKEQATQRRAIDEAYQKVQAAISRKWWVQARRLADRFIEQFPDTDEARALPEQLSAARDADREQSIRRLVDAIADGREDDMTTLRDALTAFGTGQPMADALAEVGKRLMKRVAERYRASDFAAAGVLARRIVKELPNTAASQAAEDVLRRIEARSAG